MLEDGFALFGQFIKWMEAGVLSGSGAANTEEVIYLRDPVNPWVSPACSPMQMCLVQTVQYKAVLSGCVLQDNVLPPALSSALASLQWHD